MLISGLNLEGVSRLENKRCILTGFTHTADQPCVS